MSDNLKLIVDGIYDNIVSRMSEFKDLDIVKTAKIDEENINRSCLEHSGLYAYWVSMYRVAQDLTRRAEFTCDMLEQDLNTKVRADAAKSGAKTTEAAIMNAVKSNEEYRKCYMEYLNCKKREGILEAFVRALEHRKDMLMQVSATIRMEVNADIVRRERNIEDQFTRRQ